MHKALPVSAAAMVGFLLLGMRKRRSKWWAALSCFVLLGLVSLAVGCGGSSSSSSTPTSTNVATGTYTLTLNGADTTYSSITGTTTFTLTVN